MPLQFRLPKLAEGDATGSVAKLLVRPGDEVAVDQSVLEVETEKAVVEVPSTVGGKVMEVHVAPGDEVREGTLVLTLAAQGAPTEPSASPAAAAVKAPAAAPLPVAPAAPAAPAAAAAPDEPPAPAAAPASESSRATGHRTAEGLPVPAAPSVRRFARELAVDLVAVHGSGPAGRISIADVKSHVRAAAASPPAPYAAGLPALPDLARFGPVHRQPASAVRRATAQHLGQSWPSVPQVTQFDEADITELEALRQRFADRVAARGGKLTVTAVLLKVASQALRRFPQFNASYDAERGEIVFRDYIHVGVAVDTDRGLLVPVVRDVDRKSIEDLSRELGEIAQRARTGKLTLDEMQGGGFSISNLGGIGGTGFTPIVNWPEVAILGVARQRTAPRWNGEGFIPRTMLPLGLSYDHRLIDGADAARFLRYVCEIAESPFLLALEG